MSEVQSHLLNLNIFKSILDGKTVSIAINNRSQLVVACSNIVKTTIATDKRNYYKLLEPQDEEFDIVGLSFNPSGHLIALIGHHDITICDTKSLPQYDGQSVIWDPFNFQLGPFESAVKAVEWHPASALNSEVVVLTENEILLYDVVYSFKEPITSLKLLEYSQLKGKTVESIAFGSTETFSGLTTLYLSTDCGSIYAIAPFLSKSSKIKAKKSAVATFIAECKQVFETVQNKFPPIALVDSPHVAALSEQYAFAHDLERQLRSPLNESLNSNDDITLSHSGERFGFKLSGPIAECGAALRLKQFDSNDRFSFLSTVHSDKSTAVFSYLAQFNPLIMGWDNAPVELTAPIEPKKQLIAAKEPIYAKPSRGFGYIIESESEAESEDTEFEKKMTKYRDELDIYKLKKKVSRYFEENFNLLTTLSVDQTSLSYKLGDKIYFQNVGGSRFIWANAGQLLYADSESFLNSVLLGDGNFEFDYKVKKVNPLATGFCFYEDPLEGLGSFVIAYSSSQPVEVIQLTSPKPRVPALSQPKTPITTQPVESPLDTKFLTEELSNALKSIPTAPLPRVDKFNAEDSRSLLQIKAVSDTVFERSGEFMKFMLRLQLKVMAQLEVLRIQAEDLNVIHNTEGKSKKTSKSSEKIEQLITRQSQLLERLKSIKVSVLDRFEQSNLRKNLPLSAAEKEWFKEINHINKIINVDDGDDQSIVTQYESLQDESLRLLEGMKAQLEVPENKMDQIALGNELSRIKLLLGVEDKRIAEIKHKAESCYQRILHVEES